MTTDSFSADQAQTQEVQPQGNSFTPAAPVDTQVKPPEGVTPPTLSADDLAALQKRDTNAQSHITTLEAEAAQRKVELVALQDKLDQAANVEEVLRQKESTTVDVDDIVTKATQALASQQAATAAQDLEESNFKDVSDTLSSQYGADKVDEAVKQACSENGMTWEDMVALAKANPLAAKRLCNVEVKAAAQPIQASINTSALLGQYQQSQETPPKVNVMDIRNDSDRVADFTRRMEAKLKELNH